MSADEVALKPLAQLDHALSKSTDLESLVRPILEIIQSYSGLESVYFTTIDLERQEQRVVLSNNQGALAIEEGLVVPWADTLCKRALAENLRCSNQVQVQWGDSQAARELGIQAYCSVPVEGPEAELIGTLCGASSVHTEASEQTAVLLHLCAQIIASHIEREKLIVQLRQANLEYSSLAFTDPLTGLANRRALLADSEQLVKRAGQLAGKVQIGFIDLDGFKAINDDHGHDAGDRFLIQVAQRLQAGLRAEDLLARIGGDEFVVLTVAEPPFCQDQEDSLRQRLQDLTSGTYDLGCSLLPYGGASVGVITADPREQPTAELIQQADQAMYAVKQQRRRGDRLR